MERWALDRPRWWGPILSPAWVRLCTPYRRWRQRRDHRLVAVEVRGVEQLRRAVERGGVLVTPNHAGHADGYALYAAGDALGRPSHFMVAWQVLAKYGRLGRLALRLHGCFSVDREGNDLRAFRQAVELLQTSPNPLIIFPEGEVYHVNDRVTPFREGPAAIALAAARRAPRPVLCVPAAIKYRYVADPMPELLALLDRLELRVGWRPRPDLSPADRVARLGEGLLALREVEHLGRPGNGPLAQRIPALAETLLGRLEARHGAAPPGTSLPERVKVLRQAAVKRREARRVEADADLEDLHLVTQLFSYPADYLAERPTLERLAETLDKLEEDVLGVAHATPRGTRRAVVAFGEPVEVSAERSRGAAAALTKLLEQRVQALLDEVGDRALPGDAECLANRLR